MTFEKWWGEYPTNPPAAKEWLRDAWDAATYAANTRAGDASNEAEKDARRKVAIDKLRELISGDWDYEWECRLSKLPELMDAIIKEAQG